MKKLISTVLLAVSFVFGAASQIPNGGFELLNPDNSLRNWGAIYMFSAIGDTTGGFVVDSISINDFLTGYSTDAHQGNHALELRTGWNVTQNTPIVAFASADEDSVYSAWGNTEVFFVQRTPISLSFYYKYHSTGGDAGKVQIQLFSGCGMIDVDKIVELPEASDYTLVTIPLDEFRLSGGQIWGASIQFASSLDDSTAHFGSSLLIDDVAFEYATTSISELENGKSVALYPNPAGQVLNIQTDENNYDSIEILNSIGKSVMTVQSPQNIDISRLPSGAYFIRLAQEQKATVLKFMKM